MARNGSGLRYEDNPVGQNLPNPFGEPSDEIDISDDTSPTSTDADGTIRVELPDGSVTIELNPRTEDVSPIDTPFNANLAERMDDMELSALCAEILDGIDADEQSRKEWMKIRSDGIAMLALKIEEPRGDMGSTSAPVEGQSTIRHSLMLEATVAFQAGARGELLPARGPVKVQNFGPPAAPQGEPYSEAPLDELANGLEADFNFYLKNVAREYIPDTDRMFFQVAFGGDGFKKLFHCPLRRRPVSESVEAENLIVSNAATDLSNCGRVTHKIKMRKSTMRRMQIVGAYRDVDLVEHPAPKPPDEVEQEKADIQGYKAQPIRPKDADRDLYESYVELDLPQFAPQHLKNKGLPLSYKVTIDVASRQILEVRRNWRENDKECEAKQVFVQYPFIRGLGFYGLGFVHLLGNSVMALTAGYREMLDSGMFANFPGMLHDKQIARQLTNQFRCPPGGSVPIDLPVNKRIQDVIMPIPYKEVGPAFPAFLQHLEDRTKQIAMVANSSIGEGKQDAPVGTTLALIEQATKVEASAFKRLHDAQAEEFRILKDLFREDPEAMWRHCEGKTSITWQKAQFLQALERYELVPVADPNNPTALHRAMKAAMLKMLAMQNPQAYDMIAVDKRIMSMANIDPQGMFKPPMPGQPDPMMVMLQARLQLQQAQVAQRAEEHKLKAAMAIQEAQGKAADRASRERIEHLKLQIAEAKQQQEMAMEKIRLAKELMEHMHGMQQAAGEQQMKKDQFGHQRMMDTWGQAHQLGQAHRESQQFEHQRGMDNAGQQREERQFGHQQQMDQAGHELKEKQANKPEAKGNGKAKKES